MSLQIKKVSGIRDFSIFVRMARPAGAYREVGEIPPDRMEDYSPATNPVHRHLEAQYFIAYRDNRPTGRIAAIKDHLNPQQDTGFFGCFECENDAVAASALIETARDWLARKGCTVMVGPATFNSNQKVGFLLKGYSRKPQPTLPHNPPYYNDLMLESGLKKETDLLTFTWHKEMGVTEKIAGYARQAAGYPGLALSRLNPFNGRAGALTRDLFNGTMSGNWGYIPLTMEESASMMSFCAMHADPDFMVIMWAEGKPAGIAIFLPTGQRGPQKSIRAAILGVMPEFRGKGLYAYLINHLIAVMVNKKYDLADVSQIHEDNRPMIKILSDMGLKESGRYRVYTTR
ncbi:MAG: GNAT family N-acetyltransferase [Bacillota bacterium]